MKQADKGTEANKRKGQYQVDICISRNVREKINERQRSRHGGEKKGK